MPISRRDLLTEAPILGLLGAIAPELNAAQTEIAKDTNEDVPHDSYACWNGFFDSVNPDVQGSGQKAATRGPADQLPDPGVQTQYLHYKSDEKKLRYATEIGEGELLDHDADVAVGISLSQYRPAIGSTATNEHAAQLRLDTTQIDRLRGIAKRRVRFAGSPGSKDRSSGAGDEQDPAHQGHRQDSGQHLQGSTNFNVREGAQYHHAGAENRGAIGFTACHQRAGS
jgi:hypothetical protein